MKTFADILMTMSEVAAFLRVSKVTIWRMLKRKELTSLFLPNGYRRFLRQDIYDFIDYDSGLIRGQLKGQQEGNE